MTSVDVIRDDDNSHLHTIEQACIRFEAAWGQGQKPDLTEYLQDLSGEARQHALCELLWIEWDNLRRLGTPPTLEDYRTRFAELPDAVDEAWRSDFRRLATEDRETTQTRGGRYTILKSHARGGFGQVYVAQDEELGRQVALKEIQRRHAKSQIVQERFVREAKITGKLEHPGIVPVYSVGTKPDGTPFYAMRFVQGESLKAAIDEFHLRGDVSMGDRVAAQSSPAIAPDSIPAPDQDELAPSPSDGQAEGPDAEVRSLSNSEWEEHQGTRRQSFRSRAFRQLLSRFVYVCNVMEYAHSHGVLHRDLKPGNIMLGRHGETLVVDWGLAKEVGQPEPRGPSGTEGSSLTNMSFTTHGALIGTVCYMSPEQAAGKLGELTVASDTYSLGATLYHLLVGQAPLAKEPRDRLLTRIQRGDIPRAKSVQPAVPGPLDAICANAMSHDPADRYESAAALADDLEHWLADEAVMAYAEPRSARIARWARRHQTAMATTIITALVIALASATIAVLIAFNNRQLETARADNEVKRIAAENARKEAETERDLSNSIADFMVKCFRSADPWVDRNTITVAEILDRSFDDVKSNTNIPPATKVRFLEALADSNLGLGLYSRAVNVAEYACGYSRQHFEPDDEELLDMQETLASAYLDDNQIAKAVINYEDVVEKTNKRLGKDHPLALLRQQGLVSAYCNSGRLDEASLVCQEGLTTAQLQLGRDDPITLTIEHTFADVLRQNGRLSEAIAIYKKVLEARKSTLGVDHHDTLACQNNLANAYIDARRYDDAISLHSSTLTALRNKLGSAHPDALSSQSALASTYLAAGNFEKAILLHKQTLEWSQTFLGADHPDTLLSQNGLASAYKAAGRNDEAIYLHRNTLERRREKLGAEHPHTLNSQNNLASTYQTAGRYEEALLLHKQTIELRQESLGLNHPSTLISMYNLATAYEEAGRMNEAIDLFRQTWERRKEHLGAEHLSTLQTQVSLASALLRIGYSQDAIPLLEQNVENLEHLLGKNHPDALTARVSLAKGYRQTGRSNDAVQIYRELLLTTASALGADHPQTLNVQNGLATVLAQMGEAEEAATWYEKTLSQQTAKLGTDHPATLQSQINLVICFQRLGRFEQALRLLESLVPRATNKLGWAHQITLQSHFALAEAYKHSKQQTHATAIYELIITQLSEHFGTAHVDTISAQRHFADYLFAQGKHPEAISRLKDAVETLRETLGRENMTTLEATRELATALRLADRLTDSDPYFRELVAIGRKREGGDELTHANNLYWLGMCQIKQEKYSDAEASLRECWAIRQRIAPANWTTAIAENVLGLSLAGQKKFEEAEKHLIAGFDAVQLVQDKIPPEDTARIMRQAAQRIIELYELWEKPDQTERWRKKLPMQPLNQ